MGEATYSLENVIVVLIGLLAIAGGILLFRHRAAAYGFIIDANTRLYGTRFGERISQRSGPGIGVGVPAIGFILIGTVFVLAGAFDWIS